MENELPTWNRMSTKIHQVVLKTETDEYLNKGLRRLFQPVIDQESGKVYLWHKRIDHIDIYELDMLTGNLLKKINLERFQNVRDLQAANGYIYFISDYNSTQKSSRLYRLKL